MTTQTIQNLTALTSRSGLSYFCYLLNEAGITDSKQVGLVAQHTINLWKSQGKKGLTAHPELIELEKRWYQSVRIKKKPDYSVYDEKIYLAEVWACWDFYSRKYLKDILKPKLVPPFGIQKYVRENKSILDLGNGIGFSSIALSQIFPKNKLIATNVKDSYQWDLNKLLAKYYDYLLITNNDLNLNKTGEIELTFASEYFEHFEEPIDHLSLILEKTKTKILITANAFNTDSIGHFDSYLYKGQRYEPSAISRLFGKKLKENNYIKLKTKCWNARPAIWIKDG